MHIEYTNFFIQIIAFAILYFLLQKFAFKPLFGIMEKRRQLVLNQVQIAEENRKQAEEMLQEQKQLLIEARKQAFEIVEQAKMTSTTQAEEIMKIAKQESMRIKEDALKDIENEKNKAIAALRSQIGGLSVLIASKIIEKQVDEKSNQQLIEHYLKDMGGNS